MANVKITETVLNGAQKTLMTGNMPIEDILPGLELMDKAGYHSCEVWGRTSYVASMNMDNEDPWDRLRKIKNSMPNTKLQLTFGGQYLLGIRPFASDLVEYFVKRCAVNGINILRVFDPLNDIRNLEASIKASRSEGVHVQGTVLYTKSPVHNTGSFLGYAKKLESLGADSICITDSSELLLPYETYQLIAALKQEVDIPIQFSSCSSTGLTGMNTLKAVEAGADLLDTAVSPFAGGSSYPATEAIVAAFRNTPYDSGMELEKIWRVEEHFSALQTKYLDNGMISPQKFLLNPLATKEGLPVEALDYMLSSLMTEKLAKLSDILREIPEVRAAAGNPPLAFPLYRAIIDQAVLNVFSSEPYSEINEEFANLIVGKYGATPAAVDPGFRAKTLGSPHGTALSPAGQLEPELESFQQQLPEKFNEQPEDILTLAQFPIIAPKYFEARSNRLYDVDNDLANELTQVHPI